jgi:membrane protein involved in colicin uptake
MSTMKAQAAKVPAKKTSMVPAKTMSTLPAKAAPKTAAKAPAKAPAKPAAKAPAKATAKVKAPAKRKSSQEAMLARVEAVRLMQRESGHFDCFGRASSGYCDQGGCAFHAECLSVSRMIHAM